jgi:hypothetical protein
MKPGDLVKLLGDSLGSVMIGSFNPDLETWLVDHGTIAVFLDVYRDEDSINNKKLTILVKDRVGWIYADECEVIND